MIRYRYILAAVLAPLAGPATLAALALAIAVLESEPVSFGPVDQAMLYVAIIYSYGGFLLVGLPIAYGLHRLQKLTFWSLSIAGALGGVLIGLLLPYAFLGAPGTAIGIVLTLFACPGFSIAAVFSLIAGVRVK